MAVAEPLIPEGRLVLVHYMTKMIPGPTGERYWVDPDSYDPHGSTATLGGLHHVQPMWAVLNWNMPFEDAIRFEIETAISLGIDGFQFYYPYFQHERAIQDYNRIIRTFVETAAAEYPGFKLSLCLCVGGRDRDISEAERIEFWGGGLKALLEETSTLESWLRTSDGKLLFFHWVTDNMADGVPHLAQPPSTST